MVFLTLSGSWTPGRLLTALRNSASRKSRGDSPALARADALALVLAAITPIRRVLLTSCIVVMLLTLVSAYTQYAPAFGSENRISLR